MRHVPILAAQNVLSLFIKITRKRRPECLVFECVETSVAQRETIVEILNSMSRVPTVYFEMPDNGHYCIALTLYAF